VTDDLVPSNGVRIKAASSGVTPDAIVNLCGGSAAVSLNAGDEVVATCGSVTVEVVTGSIEIYFIADDGTMGETTLSSGNTVTFHPDTLTFTPGADNTEEVNVLVDGQHLTFPPLSIRDKKSLIVDDLHAIKSEAEAKQTVKKINDATKKIGDGLESKLWASDGNRLDSVNGEKVFNKDAEAIKIMMDILKKDSESDTLVASLADTIKLILSFDQTLASEAISLAQSMNLGQKAEKNITKAVAEMDEAARDEVDGNYEKTATHYGKAWKLAEKAMRQHGGGDEDEDEDEDEDGGDDSDKDKHDGDKDDNN